MNIVIATSNQGKVREFRSILEPVVSATFVSLDSFTDVPEVIEDSHTFEENAHKKAIQIAYATRTAALADDSGLIVDALHGAPGVLSARYAGAKKDDADNIKKLLQNLEGVGDTHRTAHFSCTVSFYDPVTKTLHSTTGVCDGMITHTSRGAGGFGYDPIFVPRGQSKTMAELSADEKNTISHRAKACRLMATWLQQWIAESHV